MTRQECENKIMEKLEEIKDIADAYIKDIGMLNIGVGTVYGKKYLSVFALERDQYGEPIEGKYLLDKTLFGGAQE